MTKRTVTNKGILWGAASLVTSLLFALAVSAVYAESGSVAVSGGTLSVSPADVTLSGVTLAGTDTTTTSAAGSNTWSGTDPTGTGSGWSLTIISTDFGIDEVQQVDIGSASSGSYTLSFDGQGPTASIAFDASAATVESSLEALSNITDVTVTGTGTSGDPWVVTFVNPGKQNVAQMTSTDTGLTSTISTTTQGRTIDISSADQEFKIQLLDSNITFTDGNTKPTSSVASLTNIPETGGSALKFASAAVDAGMGTYTIKPNFELEVLAETFAGTYTATFTVAIVSGP